VRLLLNLKHALQALAQNLRPPVTLGLLQRRPQLIQKRLILLVHQFQAAVGQRESGRRVPTTTRLFVGLFDLSTRHPSCGARVRGGNAWQAATFDYRTDCKHLVWGSALNARLA